MEKEIDSTDIQGMIQHWLRTPENAYLGSSYGRPSTILEILKKPYSLPAAQSLIQKMRTDIPPLTNRNISLSWGHDANKLIVIVDENQTAYTLDNQ